MDQCRNCPYCPVINDKCDGCKELVEDCNCRRGCKGTPYDNNHYGYIRHDIIGRRIEDEDNDNL